MIKKVDQNRNETVCDRYDVLKELFAPIVYPHLTWEEFRKSIETFEKYPNIITRDFFAFAFEDATEFTNKYLGKMILNSSLIETL